jgi:hypothetical protein
VNRASIAAITPLSPIQEGLLFHALAEPTPGLYTEQAVCELQGPLDVEAFRRAWSFLVARHDALRAAFVWKGVTRPVQVFSRAITLDVPCESLMGEPDRGIAARIDTHLREGREIACDLSRPPLMRVAVLRTAADRHLAIWTIHHLVHDAWALSILLRELLAVYATFARNGAAAAPALPDAGSYADFIGWLGRTRASGDAAFWRSELAGLRGHTAPRPLPGDGTGSPSADPFDRVAVELDDVAARAIDACARHEGLTLNTLAIGAWGLTLAQDEQGADVLFGVTTSGRSAAYPGVEQIVGPFINTLPFRIAFNEAEAADVRTWLRGQQHRQLALVQHEADPIREIRAWADLPSQGPLFESLVVCQNALERFEGRRMGDVEIVGVRSSGHPHYPLMCRITPGPPVLVEIVFDGRRLARAVAADLLDDVTQRLASLPVSLDRPLRELRRDLSRVRARRADERHHARGIRLGQVKRQPAGAVARHTRGALSS